MATIERAALAVAALAKGQSVALLRRILLGGGLVLFGLIIGGCAKSERLYNIRGKVTYGGAPVPKGKVFFDPDSGAENPTVSGVAGVEGGAYDTAKDGQGIQGGTYVIRVQGYTGKAANEAPFGQALFSEYTFSKELPAADTVLDIDVPRAAR